MSVKETLLLIAGIAGTVLTLWLVATLVWSSDHRRD